MTAFVRSKFGRGGGFRHLRNNGSAIFDYNFLMSLDEKYYSRYLSQAYLIKTGRKLDFRRVKTINEKIQWLKIFDNIPVKTLLTDKFLVRNWVKEKIGGCYLKSLLWSCDSFDSIDFDVLPDKFIIKANHGCKWHFIIKDKTAYLGNEHLYNVTKLSMDGWMKQSFFGWSDFETQYKNIKPRVLVEDLYRNQDGSHAIELEIWCFNGVPVLSQQIKKKIGTSRMVSTYDKNFNNIDLKFLSSDILMNWEVNPILLKAFELSKILAEEFCFVRIDWMVHNDKLYFSEMTFTPFSGFISFPEEYSEWQLKLGNMLNLKGY